MSARCHGCGLDYTSPAWADVVIPDEIWRRISPDGEGNGVLCFNCMNRRLVRKGLDNVPCSIKSGPMENVTEIEQLRQFIRNEYNQFETYHPYAHELRKKFPWLAEATEVKE